jgi:hypothetical protein
MRLSLPRPARRDSLRKFGARRGSNPISRSSETGLLPRLAPNLPIWFFLAIILIAASAASAQELQPLVGIWHLNFAESTFLSGPSPYKRLVLKIEPWSDGLKVVYDMIGVRGGITHWEWTGRLDGMDYPLQGVEEVVTNAYSQTGAGAYSVITKIDGRISTRTTIEISSDGKAMTVTSPTSNARGQAVINKAIYNKQ